MSTQYIAFTFAPVQGFIEKSRKLRDLYGASRLLSHLSAKIVALADDENTQLEVISPALVRVQPESERGGIPNRILFKGNFSDREQIDAILKTVEETFLGEWRRILIYCKAWIENALKDYYQHEEDWCWKEEWNHWASHAWELFFGLGTTISNAISDLENCKLRRNWIAINWIGESSSLTGTDGIAFPGLGGEQRNPKTLNWSEEDREIKRFYRYLAFLLDDKPFDPNKEPEGKYIAANEKLSIPELTKRLVTYPKISQALNMPELENFTELVRKAQDNPNGNQGQWRKAQDNPKENRGQWTGWFMGDGDEVGKYLIGLADEPNSDAAIKEFSQAMRNWGNDFYNNFPEKLGRVVYAGGDDFFGVIYNKEYKEFVKNSQNKESNKEFPENSKNSVNTIEILNWLMQLPQEWKRGKSEEVSCKITLSLGFVWASPGVPQRDILQHCREAEKRSKKQGRDRVTSRIVFSNGQFVQWTTKWEYLQILTDYEDRDGEKNWSHVYTDLAQLKARRAFGFSSDDPEAIPNQIVDDCEAVLEFFDLYFPGYQQELKQNQHQLFKFAGKNKKDKAWAMIRWIHDLITVGWHFCS